MNGDLKKSVTRGLRDHATGPLGPSAWNGMDAELSEQGSVARRLLRKPAACRFDNRSKFRQSACKLLINNNIFKLWGVRDFTASSQ